MGVLTGPGVHDRHHGTRLGAAPSGQRDGDGGRQARKAWFAWDRIAQSPEAYVRKVLFNTYATWWRRKWNGEQSTDDLTEAQSAETLGCSVGTVKRQCSKAFAKLRIDPSLATSSPDSDIHSDIHSGTSKDAS